MKLLHGLFEHKFGLLTALSMFLPHILGGAENRVDMCPTMSVPLGRSVQRPIVCKIKTNKIVLENKSLRCIFTNNNKRLRLNSLYNEWTKSEMVRNADKVDIFVIETNNKRYAGSRDFTLHSTKALQSGFVATLVQKDIGLEVKVKVKIDDEGLRMEAKIINIGTKDIDFKVACPVLNGLVVSDEAFQDHYYFPWGGGVFSNLPAVIRRGYGDGEALWQVMDIYSPLKGGGIYLRVDDDKGFRKTMSLRRFLKGEKEAVGDDSMRLGTKDKYKWTTSALEQVVGTGLAVEYLRVSRKPQETYIVHPAVIAAHSGNWKKAMRAYSNWAHKVWKWRPYPSKLKKINNMMIAGWSRDFLFQDGKYRDSLSKYPRMDCIELMSWWEWSPCGPLGASVDDLESILTKKQIENWEPYIVKDPVTGKTMWNNQPGDYMKYNDRFGGLAAFQKAVKRWKQDAMITLYMDPFRLDTFSCETGKKYGRKWNFVDTSGKITSIFDVSNPCHYLQEVRDWTVSTVKRVLKDTGADGIRLDEVGYPYGACFSTEHKHFKYAEKGLQEWSKAIADTVDLTRKAMDEVDPKSVLLVEHQGYDYLMKSLDGVLSYDISIFDAQNNLPVKFRRPLEVDLQRFYFPECKLFGLDHHHIDSKNKKRFWNGVASFGNYMPVAQYSIYKENQDVYASRDCEALVPSMAKFLYINRFSANGKDFYHVYNASGRDFSGEVIKLDVSSNQHVFDMLTCKEVAVSNAGVSSVDSESKIKITLANNEVACLAVLSKLLEVTQDGKMLNVKSKKYIPSGKLTVCPLDGSTILSHYLTEGKNLIDLTNVSTNAIPVAVKLIDANGQLLDIAELNYNK